MTARNSAISANVSLVHDRSHSKPTFLAFDTGNGYVTLVSSLPPSSQLTANSTPPSPFPVPPPRSPIESTLTFLLHGHSHDSWLSPRPRHKHPHQPTHDFAAHVRTFNAPIALSVAHAPGSLPAKYHLRAANTQAAVNVTLDGMFEGIFDLRAKSAGTSVETRGGGTAVGSANVEANGSGRVSEGVSGLWAKWMSDEAVATGTGERRVEFDHEGYGRKMGWSGYGERPVEAGGAGAGEGGSGGGGAAGSAGSWGSTSRVEVVSSLSPVVLVLDGPG